MEDSSKNNNMTGGDKTCKGCGKDGCGGCRGGCQGCGKVCGGDRSCSCGCGCGWPSGHRLFRVVLWIVILLIVFWLGFKVGQFVTAFGGYGRAGYGLHAHGGGYGYQMMAPVPTGSSTLQ